MKRSNVAWMKKFASSNIEIVNEAANTSFCQDDTQEVNDIPESEQEIRLTEFVPTKIYLKKDLKKQWMVAVNHTVTTMSPNGKVVSKIKICSVKTESEP